MTKIEEKNPFKDKRTYVFGVLLLRRSRPNCAKAFALVWKEGSADVAPLRALAEGFRTLVLVAVLMGAAPMAAHPKKKHGYYDLVFFY